MRILRLPIFLAALLAALASCVEPGKATGRSSPEFGATACFVGGEKLAVMDLDTGEWSGYRSGAPLVPYTYRELAAGVTLVSWIDRSLHCGFLLLNERGSVLYRRDGYAAYEFGDGVLLVLRLGEALEDRPAEYAVEIVDPDAPGDARRYENTIPLTPTGRDWSTPLESVDRLPLLMTYEDRSNGRDYLYPWTKRFTFRALAEDGSVIWTSGVTSRRLVTGLELLYVGQGVCLIYGQYNYVSGEYLLLDSASGRLMWQSPRFVVPAAEIRYPYSNFLNILPFEERGEILRFPAYDTRERELKVAELNLQEGGLELTEDSAWLERIERAYRSVQIAPSGVEGWNENLGDDETLVLARETLSLSRAGDEVWSRAVVPDFGEGLELVSAGKKLLLLAERSDRATALSAQSVPHLLDKETGRELRVPVKGEPVAFRPLVYAGELFLVTPEGEHFASGLPFASDSSS